MTRQRKLLFISVPFVFLLVIWLMLTSNWGLNLALRLASGVMPGKFTVMKTQGSLLGPIQLHDVHYRHDKLQLRIGNVDLNWQLSDLFTGKLQIQRLAVSNVELTLPPRQARASNSRFEHVVLPFSVEVQHASVKTLRIHTAPAAKPIQIGTIDLGAHFKRQQLTIRKFVIHAYHAEASAQGDIQLIRDFPLQLNIDVRYQPNARQNIKGSGRLSGNLQHLQLTQRLSGLFDATLQAQARDVSSSPQWQSKIKLKRMNLHQVNTKLPSVSVIGDLHVSGDSSSMRSEGKLNLTERKVGQAQVSWHGSSDTALRNYELTADGKFTGQTLPSAVLTMQAKGTRHALAISQLHVATLDGKIQGDARLDWQTQLRMDADLALQDLDTGLLAKDWPGKLSAQLALHSQPVDNHYPIHFSMHQLKGELRGYPVHGEIDGQWHQQQLSLSTLQLDVAGTQLSAQGQLAKTWDMHFRAASDDLGKLLPAAQGHFDLSGRLSGKARAPRLTLNGKAQGLAFEHNQVASVDLQLDMGLALNARSYLLLQASGLQTRNTQWHQVQVQMRGTNAAQTITLQASNQGASLHSQLHGRFTPWQWRGNLDEFELNQPHYGKWHLEKPVKLELARDRYTLSSLCLVQAPAQLCVQGQWSATQRLASFDIKTFPLRLLQPWLTKDIQLNGDLNAHAQLHTTANGELRGDLVASSPDKSIALHFINVNEKLTLAASTLTAKLDSQGLHAILHLPLSSGGGIDSELRLPGWKPAKGLSRAQPLVASLQMNRIPAEVITHLVPQTAQARGQLQADLQVAGSLGEPHLHGNVAWKGGSVLVPQLGIHIREVNASLSSIHTNTVAFTIGAHSGEGDLQINGQTELDPSKGWPTHATLSSHNLEVSNNAQAYVLVDSSLKIYLQNNVINVNGEINVPRARLHPQSLPEGAVPVSPDLVIVDASKKTTFVTRWLLTAHVRVKLGDQVEFKGFGIRGKLRGNLALNDEPGKLILGQGEVSIADGIYRLRGQDLNIRRGRLIFTNTFIDNPAVDVEAVREVNTVTAGVRIKGTLKQPQLTIFSEPAMSQSDALSYLLLGHSMSQSTLAEGQSVGNAASALGLVAGNYLAKGIGGTLGLDELRVDVNQTTQNTSLVLGKYLSPKLYLRYYSGIAESSRILQLQYQLSRRLQIQTESGYRGTQSITGGDIFFTVEY